MASSSSRPTTSKEHPSPHQMNILTLNCWGLKYISTLRRERLQEIGRKLAEADPPLDIVGLQELWTQEDYASIRRQTKKILPYGKFYYSGIFGGGLAILSRWPILESSMMRYPLNGRPNAFYHGDWYVGKGVACAKIRYGSGQKDIAEVFTTHLHAPYEPPGRDTYLCHRTAQAWEISKLMRGAADRGHLVLALGDFNMIPLSLAHRLIETHTPCKDIWRILHPDSSLGNCSDDSEIARGRPVPTAEYNLLENGACSDSIIQTWRWNKNQQNKLGAGRPKVIVPLDTPDPHAKRLDYIFANNGSPNEAGESWSVHTAKVAMTERHPELDCSISDHYAVQATLVRSRPQTQDSNWDAGQSKEQAINNTNNDDFHQTPSTASSIDTLAPVTSNDRYLPVATYDEIITLIQGYTLRQRKQRHIRLGHFVASVFVSIGCLVGVWWSDRTPKNFLAFLLVLLSTANFGWGVIDGLQGGLFVGSELRALKEFEWEVRNTRVLAGGNPVEWHEAVKDWWN